MTSQTEEASSSRLIELINEHQAALNKSDEQLAQDLGLAGSNAITLVKQGKLRLSSAQFASLAVALNAPAAYVLQAWLSDMAPEGLAALEAAWPLMSVTADEERLLIACREAREAPKEPITITLQGVIAVLIPESYKAGG